MDEVVHAGRTVRLVRDHLLLDDDGPPLSVERSRPAGGPTRPAVLLVHGFAQNRYTWRISGRSFVGALVEQGHEVLNLELRGHGLSRQAGSGNATSFEDYIEDVVRVVRRTEGPVFAIGHSLGGGAIVGASSRVELAGIVPMAGLFTFATHNRLVRALGRASLAARPLLGSVRMSTGWAGELIARLYSVTDILGYGFPLAGWTPGSLERDLLEERLALGFDWTSVDVWLEMSAWANGAPVPGMAAFGGVDTPLLVVAGDHDPLVHPDDARACFEASGATDRTFVLFDRFHHDVHWGHVDLLLGRHAPEHVWPVVLDWLRERG
ncbi:MAG: alpha/beta fold hydrolase [Myxococcales bacterium]|nr:alpha/beta fold hydrolase [Myxococcales bacterium]